MNMSKVTLARLGPDELPLLPAMQTVTRRELDALLTDLHKAQSLLDDGVANLEDSFTSALAEARGNSDALGALEVWLNRAVIALQFHDMTSQLLGRVRIRAEALRRLNDPVPEELVEDLAHTRIDASVRTLMQERMARIEAELSATRFHHMDHLGLSSGEIDLF